MDQLQKFGGSKFADELIPRGGGSVSTNVLSIGRTEVCACPTDFAVRRGALLALDISSPDPFVAVAVSPCFDENELNEVALPKETSSPRPPLRAGYSAEAEACSPKAYLPVGEGE